MVCPKSQWQIPSSWVSLFFQGIAEWRLSKYKHRSEAIILYERNSYTHRQVLIEFYNSRPFEI
jgi:hypothetical protein